MVHLPVPLVIVTKLPAIVHTPDVVIDGVVLAFVEAITVNVELYAALAGAPVNVTVGGPGAIVSGSELPETPMYALPAAGT